MRILLKNIPLLCITIMLVFLGACENKEYPGKKVVGSFDTLKQPYDIHPERNPAGIGIDFYYKYHRGGANNMDDLSVSDFKHDIRIKAVKAKSIEGDIRIIPYIVLYGSANHRTNAAMAYEYSKKDSAMRGASAYEDITLEEAKSPLESPDLGSMNFEKVEKDSSRNVYLENDLRIQLKKLVIADKWLKSLRNSVENDEPVWIIRTRDNKHVKFMVTEYPAEDAPAQDGYIRLRWKVLNKDSI